jgi:Tfp pilus assembly protein FimT
MNISNQFRSRETRKSRLAGFSTIELVLVLGIMLIVAGFVIPSAVQTWYAMQLRASASQVSDLMQQARMLAAKKNATYPIRYNLANGVQQAYIDLNNNNTLDAGEPSVLLPRMTAAASAPTGGAGQPSAYVLVGDTSTGTPFDNTNTLAFSPRGLPCNYSAPPVCSTPAASYFVYYFQNGRPNGWSAVLVTKAGRSKILMWNGSTWH